ncbi:aldo/keto reductase [Advenella kashmirensis]
MQLNHYTTLGRSGLRISPVALGTMTFGTDWGWGADTGEAQRIFDAFLERGGNFVDTANYYTNGTSETLLGQYLKDRRERVVLATKYTLNMQNGNPNMGGNHRLNMIRSVEASLKRLSTDYIDLLYLHAWDGLTPGDEIMRAFDDLIRAGKVVYAGISDTPAWQVSRMQTMAELRGWSPFIAMQIEYSLIQRTVESDLLPMAEALGIGVTGWSPLGFGVLTGKYNRQHLGSETVTHTANASRQQVAADMGSLSDRNLDIADHVVTIAKELGVSAAQVSLAWILQQRGPSITPIIGARTFSQFEDNLQALELILPDEHIHRLNAISRVEAGFPHEFLQRPMVQDNIFGDNVIRKSL